MVIRFFILSNFSWLQIKVSSYPSSCPFFASGVGYPLYPESFCIITQWPCTLQHIRIIVADAGFEPGPLPKKYIPMSHRISPFLMVCQCDLCQIPTLECCRRKGTVSGEPLVVSGCFRRKQWSSNWFYFFQFSILIGPIFVLALLMQKLFFYSPYWLGRSLYWRFWYKNCFFYSP